MLESARIKGVSYHTVSRAVRSLKLKSRRSGRMVLIHRDDLINWEPMRERAPLQHRHRNPEPATIPGVVDLASGERFELARRLTAVYEAIQVSALTDTRDEFAHLIAERFAVAMEFDRVAIWVITAKRTDIILLATHGNWFAPGEAPTTTLRLPFDPVTMFTSRPDVYDGIHCWLCEPTPVRMNRAFSAPLVANGQLVGYIIGDRDGEHFSLTPSQIELGEGLATHFANVLVLRRSYDLEVISRKRTYDEADDYVHVIGNLTSAFNRGERVDELIRQSLREATRLTGSHCSGVLLQTTSDSVVAYMNHDGSDLPVEHVKFDLSLLAGTVRAFEARRPLLIPWSDASELERSFMTKGGTRSSLALPLDIDGELAGVMLINFRDEQPSLTPWHLSVCDTLAASCVAAIVKQRLHDALAAERATVHARPDESLATG
jgi:GAF domain-containing protein